MDVERIVVRLFADATPYNAALHAAEKGLLSFANVAGTLGRALDVPMQLATLSTIAMVAATGAAAYSAVRLAANYEDVAIALEVMTGSAEKGKNLLDSVNKMAVETPFKSSGLQNSAKELSAFGVEVDQIMPTLKALGDVASGVATDKLDEMMGRIVLAYGQVKTAGRLMGPEARQFVQAGVPIYDYLAKAMGKPVAMMKMMVEEGRVSFGNVIDAFNLMTGEGGRFFNMMERRSTTTSGRWSALVETIELGLRDIGIAAFEAFGTKGALDDMQKFFDRLRTNGGGSASQVFKDIREFFEDVARVGQMCVYWIDKAYKSTRDWVRENEAVLNRVGKALIIIVSIIAAVKVLVFLWATIAGILAFVFSPLGLAIAALVGIAVLLDQIGAMDEFGSGFMDQMMKMKEAFSGYGKMIHDALVAEDWQGAGKLIANAIEAAFMTMVHAVAVEFAVVMMKAGSWFIIEIEKKFKQLLSNVEGFWDFVKDTPAAERQAGFKKRDFEIEQWYQSQKKIDKFSIEEIKKNLLSGIGSYADAMHVEAGRIGIENDKKALAKKRIDQPQWAVMEKFENEMMVEYGKFAFKPKPTNPADIAAAESSSKKLVELERTMIAFAVALGVAYSSPKFNAASAERLVANQKQYESKMLELDDQFQGVVSEVARAWNVALRPSAESWNLIHASLGIWKGAQMEASRSIWQGLLGLTEVMEEGAKKVEQIGRKLEYRAEIMGFAADIRREMAKEQSKGIGFGAGQFTSFLKTMDMVDEARHGPLARPEFAGMNAMPFNLGASFKLAQPQGVIDEHQAQFARYREFQNLKRWIGASNERQPPAAVMGSVESQDIINRNSMQQTDKLQEMIQVLKAGKVIEQLQKDILEKDNKILEELLRNMQGRGF